jgi:hypothetical protein
MRAPCLVTERSGNPHESPRPGCFISAVRIVPSSVGYSSITGSTTGGGAGKAASWSGTSR